MKSTTEKLFAIGDIHGCFDKLMSLLHQMRFDPLRDSVVFLGDYVDRGPDSHEVIEYLIGLKKICDKAVFLKGNHEEMLEDFVAGKDRMTFLLNGGEETVRSYLAKTSRKFASPFPDEHLEFFRSLSLFHETEKFIFVHAGLKKGVPLKRQDSFDLLWNRRDFLVSGHDFGKTVVFGHTPFPEPHISPSKIGIDTGAVYENRLTGVELNQMKFFSV